MQTGKVLAFCFTGKLTLFTRNEARSYVQKAGHIWMTDVSSNVDYLVIADPSSTSRKAVKARQLGLKLISETEFMKMLGITTSAVIQKKSEISEALKKTPATWKKCFSCIVKNLGLKSQVKWNGYDYANMKKTNVEVTIYYLVNADIPDYKPDKVVLAMSGYVYKSYTDWYGIAKTGWCSVELDDIEEAYKTALHRLLNHRNGLDPQEPSYVDKAIHRINVWKSPQSRLPVPNIPVIEFDSPDELQLILASYGWNIDIDDEN